MQTTSPALYATTSASGNELIDLGALSAEDFAATLKAKPDSQVDRLCRAMNVNPYAADWDTNLHSACQQLHSLWKAGVVSTASVPRV